LPAQETNNVWRRARQPHSRDLARQPNKSSRDDGHLYDEATTLRVAS